MFIVWASWPEEQLGEVEGSQDKRMMMVTTAQIITWTCSIKSQGSGKPREQLLHWRYGGGAWSGHTCKQWLWCWCWLCKELLTELKANVVVIMFQSPLIHTCRWTSACSSASCGRPWCGWTWTPSWICHCYLIAFIMLEDQPAVTTDEYVRTRVGF